MKVPVQLKNVLARKPVLWVGAGASCQAKPKLPTLQELANTLAESSWENPPAYDDPVEVFDAFLIDGKGRKSDLHAFLEGNIRPGGKSARPGPLHEHLAALAGCSAFTAVIDTNYDLVLRRAFDDARVEYTPSILDRGAGLPPSGILYLALHGSTDDWSSIVLTMRNYEEYDRRYPLLKAQLDILLFQHPVIFVGCSLEDRRLLNWVADLSSEYRSRLPMSVAILEPGGVDRLKEKRWDEHRFFAEMLEEFVDFIELPDYDTLPKWFEQLAAEYAVEARGVPQSPPHYIGLRSYEYEDEKNFFGRRKYVDNCEQFLTRSDPKVQFLLIKGSSGVGKSSIVKAGLLPRLFPDLTGGKRPYIYFKPGDDPFVSLASAINSEPGIRRDPREALRARFNEALGANLNKALGDLLAEDFASFLEKVYEVTSTNYPHGLRVIYIDQFEEMLLTDDPARVSQDERKFRRERRRRFAEYIQRYVYQDKRNVIIATVRADYANLPSGDDWRGVVDLLSSDLGEELTVDSPDLKEELDEIVMKPARSAGFEVDKDFMDVLRSDLTSESVWLPVLSLALQQIVELLARPENFRTGRVKLGHYQELGGLSGIIEKWTRSVMHDLTAEEPEAVKVLQEIFPHLVRLDQDGLPTRRRFSTSHLETFEPQIHRFVVHLIDERLLTPSENEIELISDKLLDSWPELRDWIENRSDDLNKLRDLEGLAQLWENGGRRDDRLLRGKDLDNAERMLERYSSRISNQVKEYVAASRTPRDQEASGDQEALNEAINEGNISEVLELLLRNVRLTPEQIHAMDYPAFYYALYPDQIPGRPDT